MNGVNPPVQAHGGVPLAADTLGPCPGQTMPNLAEAVPTQPQADTAADVSGSGASQPEQTVPVRPDALADGITLFTIGFAKRSAKDFFESLRKAGVRKVVDIRLNNASQLAGFTKKQDLAYFLQALAQIEYEHRPELAPTKEILDGYKKKRISWEEYEDRFRRLIAERRIESLVQPEQLQHACLLCSEPTADKCHRRLVAEYLRAKWGAKVHILHL